MPADAFAVHGLTEEFLADFPTFDAVADQLVEFIGEDRVVIHNAEFDLAFLNMELERLGRRQLGVAFVDTLAIARGRFPGAPASLDALCRRFAIDLSVREKHGADIDCGLLAEVYIELLGGRQPGLDFAAAGTLEADLMILTEARPVRPPRPHAPLAEELAAHQAMLVMLKTPIWSAA